jgi:hypothetical protein
MYLFNYTGVQHDFNDKWCSCRLTVTRRVSLVEQERLTLTEWGSYCSIFSFLSSILQIVVFWFFLDIVLPVLRYTDYDYLFGIFKLFV